MITAFISCVKTKRNYKCKAKDMYVSPLFKGMLAYARTLTTDKNIYILSAKYGVLALTDEIEPYNATLNTMTENKRKLWALYCLKQIKSRRINRQNTTYFLCGENYRKHLLKYFPKHKIPLKGVPMGRQIKFLKEFT